MKGYVEELIAMVGSRAQDGTHSEPAQILPGNTEPVKELERGRGIRQIAPHRDVRGNGSPRALSMRAGEPQAKNPEIVIPFDEDF